MRKGENGAWGVAELSGQAENKFGDAPPPRVCRLAHELASGLPRGSEKSPDFVHFCYYTRIGAGARYP